MRICHRAQYIDRYSAQYTDRYSAQYTDRYRTHYIGRLSAQCIATYLLVTEHCMLLIIDVFVTAYTTLIDR